MAVQDATTLKGYFNTGDVPTEAQFADLIDSTINTGLQVALVSGTSIKTINSTSLLGSGDIAISGGTDIPVQASAPATPSEGDLWVDSDAIASSGYSLLVAETVVSGSAATSVTFSGLDGNAAGGYVLEVNHVGAAANNTLIAVYLNGDTTASNYRLGSFTCYGASTVGRAEVDAPAYTANTDIGNTSNTVADISATGTVMCRGYSKIYNGSSSQTNAVIFYFAQKKVLANVTSIDLVSTSVGGIGVGSTFRLYRRK